MMQFRTYLDLTNAEAFTHSWLPYQTFPLGDATVTQRELVRQIAGIEVHLEEPSEAADQIEHLMRETAPSWVLYLAEAYSAPRSRLRSRRSLVEMRALASVINCLEKEYEVGPGQTHKAALLSVSSQSTFPFSEYLRDGERAFAVASKHDDWLTDERLRTVLFQAGPKLPGVTFVDYMRLCLSYCPRGDIVARLGGLSGEGDADLQLFLPRSLVENTLSRLQRASTHL
jgi:hypothetical protein